MADPPAGYEVELTPARAISGASTARSVSASSTPSTASRATTGRYVRALSGTHGDLRLRVADWRMRYVLDTDAETLTVLRILPRGRPYRDG